MELSPSIKTNNNYYINKNSDIYLIEGIKIPIKYNLDMFHTFELITNHIVIISIPFYLLLKLSCVKQTSTHHLIYIPKQLFSNIPTFSGFPVYTMINDICCSVIGKYNIHYSLIEKRTYINDVIKNEWKMKNSKQNGEIKVKEHINQYFDVPFKNQKRVCVYTRSNKLLENTSGIFVKTYKKLNNICLTINNMYLFDYDNDMIQFVGKTIYEHIWSLKHKKALQNSLINILPLEMINIINNYARAYQEYLYWIPFNPHSIWNDEKGDGMDLGSFNGDLYIQFDKNYSGHIYFMCHTILRVTDGYVKLGDGYY